MSSIIFQDINKIEYSSIKFDYLTISTETILNQNDDEKLLVYQNGVNSYSLIALKNGLYLNTTRENAQQLKSQNYGLYVDGGDAKFTGTLYTKSIVIGDINLSESNIDILINKIDENIANRGPFDKVIDPLYDKHRNYYTHANINILANAESDDARSNLHYLNINRSAECSANTLQFAIRNNSRNHDTDEQSELLLGIVGNDYRSPAIIKTSTGKSLEFHVSKENEIITNLYNGNKELPTYSDYKPSVCIDTSNCLSINDNTFKEISYSFDDITNTTNTILNVEGLGYIKDLAVYDYTSDSYKHLNELYLRNNTNTFYPNQIYSGEFNGNYAFSSNVNINQLFVSNLSTDTLEIPTITSENINSIDINCEGNLKHNGSNLSIQHIDVNIVYYTIEKIHSNLLKDENIIYERIDIINNLKNILNTKGHINISDNLYGILEIPYNQINNLFSHGINIQDKLYTTNSLFLKIYDKFYNYGSEKTEEFINNLKIIYSYSDIFESNIFENLIKNTNIIELHNQDYIIGNLYNLLYDIGYDSNILEKYIIQPELYQMDSNILSQLLNGYTYTNFANNEETAVENINISGFNYLFNVDSYPNDEVREGFYSNIINYKSEIENKYLEHISNIYIDNKINIYEHITLYGLENVNNYNIISNINIDEFTDLLITNLNLEIEQDSNIISNLIYNDVYTNGLCNLITSNYTNDFNNEYINYIYNNIENNLLTDNNLYVIDTLTNKILEHTDNNNNINGLYNLLNDFDYNTDNKENLTNRILLNFITNYETEFVEQKTILRYTIRDFININDKDISFDGKLGVGYNPNGHTSLLSIYRDDNYSKNITEFSFTDKYSENEEYKVDIGHINREFVIKTNNIYDDHNIAFYPGTKQPKLFIKSSNGNIGINTNNPNKELHVNGDIQVDNDIFKKYKLNNEYYKTVNLLDSGDKIILDNNDQKTIDLNNNFKCKDLFIDKIFTNNRQLKCFEKRNKNDFEYLFLNQTNLFIGNDSANKQSILNNSAMVLQNTNNKKDNNTVFRLLESDTYNDITNLDYYDKYTGIEFTRYSSTPYTGWYIHNIHKKNNKENELFEIGFRNNYDTFYPFLNSQFSDNTHNINLGSDKFKDIIHINGKLNINNDVYIDGNIDISGIYKLKGSEFSSNSIVLSTLIPESTDLLINPGDIATRTNGRILNLINERSSFYLAGYIDENDSIDNYGYTQFFRKYTESYRNKNSISQFDAKFNVIQKSKEESEYSITNLQQPLASFKTVHNFDQFEQNKIVKSSIRLAILNNNYPTNSDRYWDNTHYSELIYNINSNINHSKFSIDIKNGNNVKTPFECFNNGSDIYTRFSSYDKVNLNSNLKVDTFFHLSDELKDNLLYLQNPSYPVKIIFDSNDSKWELKTDDNFILKKSETNISSLYIDSNNKIGINNNQPTSTLDITNLTPDLSALNLTNCNIDDNNGYLSNINVNFDNLSYLYYNESNKKIIEIDKLNDLSSYFTNIKPIICNLNKSENIDLIVNSNIDGVSNLTYDINTLYNIDFIISSSNISININSNFDFNTVIDNYNVNLVNYSNYHYCNTDYLNLETIFNTTDSSYNLNINLDESNYNIYLLSENANCNIFSCNFTLEDGSNYSVNIYHPDSFVYDKYKYNISGIKEIDYNFKVDIISGLNLDDINITKINNSNYDIKFISNDLSITSNISNIITDTIEIENNLITFTNDIMFNIDYINPNISSGDIDILVKYKKPHIKLATNNFNTDIEHNYYINAVDNNLEICYSDNNIYKKTLNLDNNGKLNIKTLEVDDIKITGKIIDNTNVIFDNPDFYRLKVLNNNLYFEVENNNKILFNTNNTNYGQNVIIANNNNSNIENILTICNEKGHNSYINFNSKESDNSYKIGQSSDSFDIFYNSENLLQINKNLSNQNFNYLIIDGSITNKEITTDYSFNLNNGKINNLRQIHVNNEFYITKDNDILIDIEDDKINFYKKLYAYGGVVQMSDKSVKNNIKTIEKSLDIIDNMTGVFYNNKITNKKEIGLIAQDVEKVLPEVVNKLDNDLLGIQYGNIIGLLIEGIKDLRKDINLIKKMI